MTRSEANRRPRVAIAGAGFMGGLHAQLVARDNRADIVAVADVAPDAAAGLSARHKARPFACVEALVETCAPDLLIVATVPSTHVAVMTAALKRNVPVLVEKPICLSHAEFAEVCRLARAPILYAENLLFAPRWRAAYRAVADLGELRRARAVFKTSGPHASWLHSQREGNVLFDLASHAVASCMFALPGREVRSVYAVGRHAEYSHEPVLAEAYITICFEGGASAQCDVSWLGVTAETCTLELAAIEGEVSCDMLESTDVRIARRGARNGECRSASSKFDWIYEGGYVNQTRAAIDTLLGLSSYPIDAKLAGKVVRLLEAAARSIATGSVVVVKDIA